MLHVKINVLNILAVLSFNLIRLIMVYIYIHQVLTLRLFRRVERERKREREREREREEREREGRGWGWWCYLGSFNRYLNDWFHNIIPKSIRRRHMDSNMRIVKI